MAVLSKFNSEFAATCAASKWTTRKLSGAPPELAEEILQADI
jgi:hypothetical protein